MVSELLYERQPVVSVRSYAAPNGAGRSFGSAWNSTGREEGSDLMLVENFR